jgi:hypothetical protein
LVRARTNVQSSAIPDPTVVTFLNEGLEQAVADLGPILQTQSLAINALASSIALPEEIQDIKDINYSQLAPGNSAQQVYPITIMDEDAFMQIAGYLPGISSGFPFAGFIQSDASGVQTLQIFPVVTINGFINVYYYKRPLLWDPNTSGSVTDVDPMFQDLAIIWASKLMCEARERDNGIKYYDDQYQTRLAAMKQRRGRRLRSRLGVVRDVSETIIPSPYWLG